MKPGTRSETCERARLPFTPGRLAWPPGQGGRKSVIIIALTGWGQEGDRAQSRAAGCDGHLVKPVALAELEKLLAELESGGIGQA